MIAFSTDVSVAMPGVYLLSFLIEGYVDRIIQYAASTGKKSFAIMAPQNDYGNVAAARFQEDAANFNAQVIVSARYSAGQPATAAQEVAAVSGQIDGLFIPEQADGMGAVASALGSSNHQDATSGNGRVERRPSAEIAANAGRLVLGARQFRLQRARAALQSQIQQRSDTRRVAGL